MKPDQERVKALLTDTVTLLCKNGLHYNKEMKVQGLLGITLDESDVFVVHINEKFGDLIGATGVSLGADTDDDSQVSLSSDKSKSRPSSKPQPSPQSSKDASSRPRKRRLSREDSGSPSTTPSSGKAVNVKHEPDDIILVDGKQEARSSCSQRAGSGKRTGTDDRNAMRETYSGLSLGDIQSGVVDLEQIAGLEAETFQQEVGPPTAKRHGSSQGSGSTPYVTGMVRSQDGSSGSPWDTSMAAEGSGGITGQFDPTQQGARQNDSLQLWMSKMQQQLYPSRRRPSKLPGKKQFVCHIRGCDKSFYHSYNLYRHQRYKHGNVPIPCMDGVDEPKPADGSPQPVPLPSTDGSSTLGSSSSNLMSRVSTDSGKTEADTNLSSSIPETDSASSTKVDEGSSLPVKESLSTVKPADGIGLSPPVFPGPYGSMWPLMRAPFFPFASAIRPEARLPDLITQSSHHQFDMTPGLVQKNVSVESPECNEDNKIIDAECETQRETIDKTTNELNDDTGFENVNTYINNS